MLNLTRLGTDEEDEAGQATDRSYWINRGSEESVKVAEGILALLNEIEPGMSLKYNKYYIGIARDGVPDNFLTFRARKDFLLTEFRVPRSDDVTARIENSGLDALSYGWGRYRLRLTNKDLVEQRELLRDLVRRASGTPPPIEE